MNLQYCPSVWTAKMELRSLQDELEGCVGRRSPIPWACAWEEEPTEIRPEAPRSGARH